MSVLTGAGVWTWAWVLYLAVATLVLFFVGSKVLRTLAKRHAQDDTNAGAKVMAAIVIGLLFGAGGFVAFNNLQSAGDDGIHASFVQHLNLAVGESEYLSNVDAIQKKTDAIGIQTAKLAEGNATLAGMSPSDATYAKTLANRDAVWLALNTSVKDLATARAMVQRLSPNHLVWQHVAPMLEARQDEEVRHYLEQGMDASTVLEILPLDVACKRASVLDGGMCLMPLEPAPLEHAFKDSHQVLFSFESGVEHAYEVQAFSLEQMDFQLLIFAYPMVTGFALAPFAFAGGSILGQAFRKSDTVGYKPYPGKSMGFFLALGGMFVFAIPFAAWTIRDLARRSKEGQINL